jgi:hypothetical protein
MHIVFAKDALLQVTLCQIQLSNSDRAARLDAFPVSQRLQYLLPNYHARFKETIV